jgi:hypothetical protein
MITGQVDHGLIMTPAETTVKFAIYSDIVPRVRGGIIGQISAIKEEMTIQVMRNPLHLTLETHLIHQTGDQEGRIPEGSVDVIITETKYRRC